MFDQLVVSGKIHKTNKSWTVILSAVIQLIILSVMILIPQTYIQALPNRMLSTFLVTSAPTPAPAPVSPQQPIVKATKSFRVGVQKMVAPTVIRKNFAILKDEAPAIRMDHGEGIVGDTGYDLGALIGTEPLAPPPPRTLGPQRIRVGGNVQAATLINEVMPQYPTYARTAHVSGTVVLHAIIGKDGTIQKLEYVSGPPLLMKSAMDAVKEWRYKPALLNGEPVEIDTTVNIVFNLLVR